MRIIATTACQLRKASFMITLTLRRHGGSVVLPLPRKILALLDLDAGGSVNLTIENGKLVLSPVLHRPTLAQAMAARAARERRLAQRLRDAVAGASTIESRAPPPNGDPSCDGSMPRRTGRSTGPT